MLEKCKVVNLGEPHDIYIGRPSKWGNPYSNKQITLATYKTKSRTESIEMFEKYLLADQGLMESLHELKGKVLGCWCKKHDPNEPCHGDIIAKYVNALDTKLF